MKKSELIENFIRVAKAEVGVRESGVNWGERVSHYLRSCNISTPSPWCAAFVRWCFGQTRGVYSLQKLWNPDQPAYCPSIYLWARQQGILHSKPERGDVFLYVENGWALHTGIVIESVAGGAQFRTVEGNTNITGSSEGDGVYERLRSTGPMYVFVRWASLVEEEPGATYALIGANGEELAKMPVKAERSYITLRDWCKAFSLPAPTWDDIAQRPMLEGKPLTVDWEVRNGITYAKVSDLLKLYGKAYRVDNEKRQVILL